MGTLTPKATTDELAELMTRAAGEMPAYSLNYLTPQLLLRFFFNQPKSVAFQILQRLEKQRGIDLRDLKQRAEMMAKTNKGQDADFFFKDEQGDLVPLDKEMLVVIDEAWSLAKSRSEFSAHSGHVLAAMTHHAVRTSGALKRGGLTSAAVTGLLDEFASDGGAITNEYIAAARQGEAQPYFERHELLQKMLGFLARRQKRHLILVGAEGVGKRTLVKSLAQQLAEKQDPLVRSVVQIREKALLENADVALKAGLRQAQGGVLLMPQIERFFADRLRAPFSQEANRLLQKALLDAETVIIGTTTPGAYDLINSQNLVRQHTNRLDIPAADVRETIAMLSYHRAQLEEEYDITVTLEALEKASQVAHQYIKNVAAPASAVQLTNHACALVSMVTAGHVAALPDVPADGRLDSEDVLVAATQITNIPLAKLSEDEQGKYANMVDHLHKRIIGQELAVQAVSRAVKTARVGLRDKKRPIGSFLFLGPSGVGKSELAKALAEFMFGGEEAMIVLDMSEYQEEASVNKLIGAPPGYVGFQGGGRLTNFVRERPYTVVLFDEVEKAHNRVFDVLLQVLEEGRLTDSQGRTATFSEAVIIMTSNLGARHMLVPIIGTLEQELVMDAVHDFFRPEFLNRLDEIVMFHQLTGDQLARILDLLLNRELKLAAQQGLQLEISTAAKQWLLTQNNQPEFGARPLRRLIARHLREPLADFLLSAQRGPENNVFIDAGNDALTFTINT
jgi:ATP-dependent Clp protease ATP-binding subunit ClpC